MKAVYENSIIVNNNIVSIQLNKSHLEEINNGIRNNIIDAYNKLISSKDSADKIFDYFIFTGKLGFYLFL